MTVKNFKHEISEDFKIIWVGKLFGQTSDESFQILWDIKYFKYATDPMQETRGGATH